MPAPDATMRDDASARSDFKADRRHHAAALGGAVARIDIHMPTPKTIRAMIGVTRAFNFFTAIFANKILFAALKFF